MQRPHRHAVTLTVSTALLHRWEATRAYYEERAADRSRNEIAADRRGSFKYHELHRTAPHRHFTHDPTSLNRAVRREREEEERRRGYGGLDGSRAELAFRKQRLPIVARLQMLQERAAEAQLAGGWGPSMLAASTPPGALADPAVALTALGLAPEEADSNSDGRLLADDACVAAQLLRHATSPVLYYRDGARNAGLARRATANRRVRARVLRVAAGVGSPISAPMGAREAAAAFDSLAQLAVAVATCGRLRDVVAADAGGTDPELERAESAIDEVTQHACDVIASAAPVASPSTSGDGATARWVLAHALLLQCSSKSAEQHHLARTTNTGSGSGRCDDPNVAREWLERAAGLLIAASTDPAACIAADRVSMTHARGAPLSLAEAAFVITTATRIATASSENGGEMSGGATAAAAAAALAAAGVTFSDALCRYVFGELRGAFSATEQALQGTSETLRAARQRLPRVAVADARDGQKYVARSPQHRAFAKADRGHPIAPGAPAFQPIADGVLFHVPFDGVRRPPRTVRESDLRALVQCSAELATLWSALSAAAPPLLPPLAIRISKLIVVLLNGALAFTPNFFLHPPTLVHFTAAVFAFSSAALRSPSASLRHLQQQQLGLSRDAYLGAVFALSRITRAELAGEWSNAALRALAAAVTHPLHRQVAAARGGHGGGGGAGIRGLEMYVRAFESAFAATCTSGTDTEVQAARRALFAPKGGSSSSSSTSGDAGSSEAKRVADQQLLAKARVGRSLRNSSVLMAREVLTGALDAPELLDRLAFGGHQGAVPRRLWDALLRAVPLAHIAVDAADGERRAAALLLVAGRVRRRGLEEMLRSSHSAANARAAINQADATAIRAACTRLGVDAAAFEGGNATAAADDVITRLGAAVGRLNGAEAAMCKPTPSAIERLAMMLLAVFAEPSA